MPERVRLQAVMLRGNFGIDYMYMYCMSMYRQQLSECFGRCLTCFHVAVWVSQTCPEHEVYGTCRCVALLLLHGRHLPVSTVQQCYIAWVVSNRSPTWGHMLLVSFEVSFCLSSALETRLQTLPGFCQLLILHTCVCSRFLAVYIYTWDACLWRWIPWAQPPMLCVQPHSCSDCKYTCMHTRTHTHIHIHTHTVQCTYMQLLPIWYYQYYYNYKLVE